MFGPKWRKMYFGHMLASKTIVKKTQSLPYLSFSRPSP